MIEQIILMHENLIYKMTNKFYDAPKEDLYQAGVIGLIKAYNNFKDNGTTKFTTYAYPYIYGEMYEVATNLRSIKLNKDILKTYKKIEQTKYLLAQKNNRLPSITELSEYLQIPEETISLIYQSTNSIMSLDIEIERPIYETVAADIKISKDNIIDVRDSMETLNPEEKEIIKYRYFKDYTQSETAKILGLSQVKVSRYEKKSLDKMYNYLAA